MGINSTRAFVSCFHLYIFLFHSRLVIVQSYGLFSFIHRDELRSFGNLVLVGPLTDRPCPVHDEDKDDTMTPITKELVDRNRDLTLHESWAATATETDRDWSSKQVQAGHIQCTTGMAAKNSTQHMYGGTALLISGLVEIPLNLKNVGHIPPVYDPP